MDTVLWRALLVARRGQDVDRAVLDGLLERATPEDRVWGAFYRPLVEREGRFVVGHLGQSIDGRIALTNGQSKWVTGRSDVIHNHRMRALFDAVVVGARTVLADNPRLTVREVEGADPVRVVLDPKGRLGPDHGVFTDRTARTLLIRGRAQGRAPDGVDVVEIEPASAGDIPRLVLERLAERGLVRVFVEGGGITVSRFLEAGLLDRLQIAVAPVILGSGRPGVTLPPIARMSEALRPASRHMSLGESVLFEMVFHD